MKTPNLLISICLFSILLFIAACNQNEDPDDPTSVLPSEGTVDQQKQAILALIDHYAQARETKDTVLLKSILTTDVDQLVSSGEWRAGLSGAMKGMMQSSTRNPGTRTLTVEKIRFLNPESGIVDARYEIQNADSTSRKMWSTFMVVYEGNGWKITAIRNMLPAGN